MMTSQPSFRILQMSGAFGGVGVTGTFGLGWRRARKSNILHRDSSSEAESCSSDNHGEPLVALL